MEEFGKKKLPWLETILELPKVYHLMILSIAFLQPWIPMNLKIAFSNGLNLYAKVQMVR